MKKLSIFKLSGLFLIFSFLVLLSSCAGLEPTLIVVTRAKTETQLLPTSSITSIPPTLTETPVTTKTESIPPTITPTETASDTATIQPTETSTHTPEPASLTLNQDTACFSGTSFGNAIIAYVNAGENYPILATIDDQSWWFVNYEEDKDCWIYGEYASTQGIFNEVAVITPLPPSTLTATLPPTSYGIYYILILKDTGGPFGCGDSLIRFYPGVWENGNMEDDILAVLNALFSNHNQYVNDLYNPIYQSQLKAKGVEMSGGDVVVQLGGSLVRPKDQCESQRMRDQIWYTINQFSPTRAVVFLNNALLGDLLVVTNK